MKRKRRTEQLSLEHGRLMKLPFIKNDGALKDHAGQLKELNATNIIPTYKNQDYNLRARFSKKHKDRTTESRNGRVMKLQFVKNGGAMKDLTGQLKDTNAANIIST